MKGVLKEALSPKTKKQRNTSEVSNSDSDESEVDVRKMGTGFGPYWMVR